MPALVDIAFIIHVTSGGLGLISGASVVILKKATRLHVFLGRVFVITMTVCAFSSLYLSIVRPNPFLFMVGIFTFYLVHSGFRALRFKRHGINAAIYDRLLSYGMLTFGVSLALYGFYLFLVQGKSFGIISVVFSIIGITLAIQDIKFYIKDTREKKAWLLNHLSRMTGGVIAAFTAFLVVNNTFLPGLVAWLLPTVIGTILIVLWSRKVRLGRMP